MTQPTDPATAPAASKFFQAITAADAAARTSHYDWCGGDDSGLCSPDVGEHASEDRFIQATAGGPTEISDSLQACYPQVCVASIVDPVEGIDEPCIELSIHGVFFARDSKVRYLKVHLTPREVNVLVHALLDSAIHCHDERIKTVATEEPAP